MTLYSQKEMLIFANCQIEFCDTKMDIIKVSTTFKGSYLDGNISVLIKNIEGLKSLKVNSKSGKLYWTTIKTSLVNGKLEETGSIFSAFLDNGKFF